MYFIINIRLSIMILFLSENEIFFQFSFKYSNNLAVWHNIFWYFILFLCFQIVFFATFIFKFSPKVPPFLYPYRKEKNLNINDAKKTIWKQRNKIKYQNIICQTARLLEYLKLNWKKISFSDKNNIIILHLILIMKYILLF
jgi:hypothetical protein